MRHAPEALMAAIPAFRVASNGRCTFAMFLLALVAFAASDSANEAERGVTQQDLQRVVTRFEHVVERKNANQSRFSASRQSGAAAIDGRGAISRGDVAS